MTMKREWNPEGYYKYTAQLTLQFDPLLLNDIEDITIQPFSLSPGLLGKKRLTKESVKIKKLVRHLCVCMHACIYTCMLVCM